MGKGGVWGIGKGRYDAFAALDNGFFHSDRALHAVEFVV